MDAMSWTAIIGTIASIGGAGVSIWQARNSRNAAEESKLVRAQLIDHRKASELAQLQAVCKRAQKSMEKYGPGSVPSSLTGISPENDAHDVQEFMLLINENRSHFGSKNPNEADEFCEKLRPVLNDFAQASESTDLRRYGTQVLLHLSNMTPIIKKHLEAKRETVH